ncbi:outer membrane beta-barrel protein [Pontibacter sp. Tf4]|uniref:outer membrane beta-barrel protein n=1 Tax=Pontibacter sp. Tf4 TaxID=2761620 RepID=UPI0016249516|nr:outer membrane beta-barrel protein [Pontibacter sp. Tf4]MBB6612849.1 outer membrane beta-barrel protein [Pontibacter sp. Tf4]
MHQKTNLLKLFLISLFITITCGSASAQSKGYIIIGDTTYKDGFLNFKESRPHEVFFQETKKSQPVYYTAEQLSVMGLEYGASYETKIVTINGKRQNLLLKILSQGKLRLYMVRAKGGPYFYVQKDSLVQLTKNNLQEELKPFATNCPSTLWHLKRLPLNQASLVSFAKALNKGESSAVPAGSVGVVASANNLTIKLSKDSFRGNRARDFSMSSANLSAGIFAEYPVYLLKGLAVTGQITYHKMEFGHSYSDLENDQDVHLEMSLMRFRLAPKYSLPYNRFNFFIETGLEGHYTLQQSSKVIQAKRTTDGGTGDNVRISYHDDLIQLPTFQYGITGGVGLQYYYMPKKYVSLSFNTGHTFSDKYTLNNFSTTLRINL